jgi:uncharacterized protein (DUF58 family)
MRQIGEIDQLRRRMTWPVWRRLGRHLGGSERSMRYGHGVEYADVREYQPGDDPRWIDWNLTARGDRTYVRVAELELAIDAWLLIDVSRSLQWGTSRCLKEQVATEFAAAALELMGRNGNRVGALFFNDRTFLVPPRGGRPHRLRLLSYLDQAQREAGPAATNLAGFLERANTVIRRRSLVVLITDFLSADGWTRPLARLALRHELVAVHVVDPREHEIPDVGIATFEDPETGRQLTVDTSSAALRARFQKRAAEQQEEISRQLVQCRVPELRLSTQDDTLERLADFLHRRRLLQGQRGRPGGPREVAPA